LRELMKKVGGIWSHIIFCRILFEGADEKVGGIWNHIIFCQILFGKFAGSGAI
jgi:superoxide dismutase